jgi:hypothetical protein
MAGHVGPTAFDFPPTAVESLQPVLEWKPCPGADVKYDVIIYAGIKEGVGVVGIMKGRYAGFWVPGKQVYYREALTNTTHVVEESLAPGTVYVWSVRTRSGERTSEWSKYSDPGSDFLLCGRVRKNLLWAFQTPK